MIANKRRRPYGPRSELIVADTAAEAGAIHRERITVFFADQARAALEAASTRACEGCNRHFAVGLKAAPTNRQTCSDRCKMRIRRSPLVSAQPCNAVPAEEPTLKVIDRPTLKAQFYSKREVVALTCLSPSTIWQLIRKGSFPASLPLDGLKKALWVADEVDMWIEARKARKNVGNALDKLYVR